MKYINKIVSFSFLFFLLSLGITHANPELDVKLNSSPDGSYNNVSISDVNNNDTLIDFKVTAVFTPGATGNYSISFPTGFEKVTSSSSSSDGACTGASVSAFTNTSFDFDVTAIGSFCVYNYVLTYKVTSATATGDEIISIIDTNSSTSTHSLTVGITTANSITKAETVDSDSNGFIDKYKLTFAASPLTNFSNTNLTVGGLTPTLDSVASNIVYIEFDNSTFYTGEKPQIEDSDGGIFDGIGTIAEITITEEDKAEPILMTVNGTTVVGVANPQIDIAENSKLTLAFSEKINSTSLTNSFTINENSVDITDTNYITFNENNGDTMYYCLGGYDGNGDCNTNFDSAKTYSIEVGAGMTDLNSNTYSGGSLDIDINVADSTPPVAGSITYNSETNDGIVIRGISGNNSYTNNATGTVNLSILGTDNVGSVSDMCISEDSGLTNDNVCDTTWKAYNTTSSFTFTGTEGVNTLYTKFKDVAGNISSVYNDSIVWDKSEPSSSSVPSGGYFNNGNFDATLNCSDSVSSCTIIYYTLDGSVPTDLSTSLVPGNTVNIAGNNETKVLKFYSVDIASNIESSINTENYVFSDSYVTISTTTSITSSNTLTFNGTCNNSLGVNDVEYSLNAGAYTDVDTDNCEASNTWSHDFIFVANSLNSINVRLKNNTTVTSLKTITHDDTAPSSLSMTINNNETHSDSLDVVLSISASDTNGVDEMCISTDSALVSDNTCNSSAWESYSNSKDYSFTGTDGTKTAYIKFKDSVGNISTVINDSIIVNSSLPTLTSSLTTGSYTSSRSTTLATDGSNIYYTTDGTSPTNTSTLYTTPLTYGVTPETVELKAISYGSSGLTSAVKTYDYVFACSPTTVANGSVAAYPTCTITCDSGYTLTGSACTQPSSGGGGGGVSLPEDNDSIERLTIKEEVLEETLEDKLFKKYGILNLTELDSRKITGNNGTLELRANLKSDSNIFFENNTTVLGSAETITAPYSIEVNRHLKKKFLLVNNVEFKSYNIKKLFFTGNDEKDVSFNKDVEINFSLDEKIVEGGINVYYSNDVDGSFSLLISGLKTNEDGDLSIKTNKLGYFVFIREMYVVKYLGGSITQISSPDNSKEFVSDLKASIKNPTIAGIVDSLYKKLEIPEINYYLNFDPELQAKYSKLLNSLSTFTTSLDNYLETKKSTDKIKAIEAYKIFLQYKELGNFEEKYIKKTEKNGVEVYKSNYEKIKVVTDKLETIILDKLNKLLNSNTISREKYEEAINNYNEFILNLTILKQYNYADAKQKALVGVQGLLKIYNLKIKEVEEKIETEESKILIKDKYSFTKELKFGDYNSEVQNLQEIMKAYGYFSHPQTTQYFGNVTKASFINFANEVLGEENSDGILTFDLIEKLNQVEYK